MFVCVSFVLTFRREVVVEAENDVSQRSVDATLIKDEQAVVSVKSWLFVKPSRGRIV